MFCFFVCLQPAKKRKCNKMFPVFPSMTISKDSTNISSITLTNGKNITIRMNHKMYDYLNRGTRNCLDSKHSSFYDVSDRINLCLLYRIMSMVCSVMKKNIFILDFSCFFISLKNNLERNMLNRHHSI